jgi:hypothetical protein
MADSTEELQNVPSRSLAARLFHCLLCTAVVASYAGAIAGAFWLLLHRYPISGAAIFTVALMVIPLFGESSWRERLANCLIMSFGVAGLYGGVGIYISLFRFEWFYDIFNNKGAGPLGLMVFAFSFAVGGGYLGCGCVALAGRLLRHGRPPVGGCKYRR